MFTSLLIYIFCYFVLILFYFKVADTLNIIDKPNQRSSHTSITIRGAGVLFPIAFFIPIVFNGDISFLWMITLGLLAISTISFIDDMVTLNNKLRLLIHIVSVALLIWQSNLINLNIGYVIPVFIIIVGVINAYNFMDGINGITALYSLITIGTLFYISRNEYFLLDSKVFISLIAAILVFAFFNFRKKAKCFSGDIGSISMSFILSFLILTLIIATGNLKWILLLGVYGLDAVATIFLRIKRKENIFDAHRSHFYQYLANEKQIPHIMVSFLYAVVQLALNYIIITHSELIVGVVFSILTLIYIVLRLNLEGKHKLFIQY